jgi:hypothetical protein
VAPLRIGGLRGKQSTTSNWLRSTGVVSTIGKQYLDEVKEGFGQSASVR